MKKHNRTWSVYEQNLLLKAGFHYSDLAALARKFPTKPVEQLVGWIEFCQTQFKINDQVLIPRVETEQLVGLAFEFGQQLMENWEDRCEQSAINIADVGTGSGVIGLSLLKKVVTNFDQSAKLFKFYLSDISSAAVGLAKENLQRLKIDQGFDQTIFLQSDLLSSYPEQLNFDLIVANLPYIPSHRLESLPNCVFKHEPIEALDGGTDGLQLIRKLIKQAQGKLKPHGQVMLEIDSQVRINETSLGLSADSLNFEIIKDQFKRQRFVRLFKT